MNRPVKLHYIKHENIDPDKWNRCIENAPNRNLYTQLWYLNIVSPNWEAFVLGDYEFVMPIPIKSKFGFKYLSQPYFAQQLGIFPIPSRKVQSIFAEALEKRFKFISYQINWQMDEICFSSFKLTKRTNLILKLFNTYNTICQNYKNNTKRNVKRAKHEKILVVNSLSTEDYFNNFESKYPIPKSALQQLKKLMTYAISNGIGEIYGAYSSNSILCAAVFFLRSGNRVVYLNAFSTDLGRKNRSMYAIIDKFIFENSKTDLFLDFEGSNKQGLARFYAGFGAEIENYYHIYSNKLPYVLKAFKK